MPKYRIQETKLGFILKKVFEDEDGTTFELFRNGKRRDSKAECARVYLFQEDALSGLMVAKRCLKESYG